MQAQVSVRHAAARLALLWRCAVRACCGGAQRAADNVGRGAAPSLPQARAQSCRMRFAHVAQAALMSTALAHAVPRQGGRGVAGACRSVLTEVRVSQRWPLIESCTLLRVPAQLKVRAWPEIQRIIDIMMARFVDCRCDGMLCELQLDGRQQHRHASPASIPPVHDRRQRKMTIMGALYPLSPRCTCD